MKIENDHRQELLTALESQVKLGLEAVGYQAVSDVKKDPIPVDTGLMKNSITFALSGESPKIGSYQGSEGSGSYRGKAPKDDVPAVYIGTNVFYAKYLEFGTSRMTKRPFMMPKIRANLGHYKDILTKYLKG